MQQDYFLSVLQDLAIEKLITQKFSAGQKIDSQQYADLVFDVVNGQKKDTFQQNRILEWAGQDIFVTQDNEKIESAIGEYFDFKFQHLNLGADNHFLKEQKAFFLQKLARPVDTSMLVEEREQGIESEQSTQRIGQLLPEEHFVEFIKMQDQKIQPCSKKDNKHTTDFLMTFISSIVLERTKLSTIHRNAYYVLEKTIKGELKVNDCIFDLLSDNLIDCEKTLNCIFMKYIDIYENVKTEKGISKWFVLSCDLTINKNRFLNALFRTLTFHLVDKRGTEDDLLDKIDTLLFY